MGQEIATSQFSQADFDTFRVRLKQETDLLASWLATDRLASRPFTAGFEMEVWLVGRNLAPAPCVEQLLQALDDPLVVPELATFNAEINCPPRALRGSALSELAADLAAVWTRCQTVGATLDIRLAMIGILPTVRPEHLSMANMAPRERYRALNDRIFRLRGGRPLQLAIEGCDRLDLTWKDVMLESAATSFQIHLKISPEIAARVYNLAKILSAPMVAITANSPFLFGKELWHETRIPLFEQAVSVGGPVLSERVNFGFRYAQASIMETFQANIDRYPILLPQLLDEPPERLAHLRLHNGTIWRWNRPLIGFDADDRPHLRIEHRVMPAGPTLTDAIANAALFYGAMHSMLLEPEPAEHRLPFAAARQNFYAAARNGLEAQISWLDGRYHPVSELLREEIVPRAYDGLAALDIGDEERKKWLSVIAARIATGQNGAVWQHRWAARHGMDMTQLLRAYLTRQEAGSPVHEWDSED